MMEQRCVGWTWWRRWLCSCLLQAPCSLSPTLALALALVLARLASCRQAEPLPLVGGAWDLRAKTIRGGVRICSEPVGAV